MNFWRRWCKRWMLWPQLNLDIDLKELASTKAWIIAGLIACSVTGAAWLHVGDPVPFLTFATVMTLGTIQSRLYLTDQLPRWYVPLSFLFTIAAVVGASGIAAASLAQVGSNAAIAWAVAALTTGLANAWVYGVMMCSHWTMPFIPLGALIGLLLPVLLYPLPWWSELFYVASGWAGHLVLGQISWRAATRRVAAQQEAEVYSALGVTLSRIAAGAVAKSSDSTRVLWHVHEQTLGVQERWSETLRELAGDSEIDRNMVDSYLQSLHASFAALYIGPLHFDLSSDVDYVTAVEAAALTVSKAHPEASVRVAPPPVKPQPDVDPELLALLESTGEEPGHHIMGQFLGGESGLQQCLALLSRSAIRAGASKILLSARADTTFWYAEVSDNAGGIPQHVVGALQHADARGQQHATLWTVSRLTQACSGELRFIPTAEGTISQIRIARHRAYSKMEGKLANNIH